MALEKAVDISSFGRLCGEADDILESIRECDLCI